MDDRDWKNLEDAARRAAQTSGSDMLKTMFRAGRQSYRSEVEKVIEAERRTHGRPLEKETTEQGRIWYWQIVENNTTIDLILQALKDKLSEV